MCNTMLTGRQQAPRASAVMKKFEWNVHCERDFDITCICMLKDNTHIPYFAMFAHL